jgi:2,4-dienoyl-CoA reductase-like NADH-dependent reductase (Old Yellow Enzyme family)
VKRNVAVLEAAEQTRQAGTESNPLFRSFKFGKRRLSNRIVMAPMTRCCSPEGIPGHDVAAYYRRRALGEVGLIISEGTHPVLASAHGYENVPVFGAKALPGWKRVIEGVHAAGGMMVPQLWHTGSYKRPGFDRSDKIRRIAPSAVAHPGYTGDLGKVVPARMTEADIAKTIEAYAQAAADAQELDFDGVEIHGAHGYLIDQFFWSVTNKRLDRFGGSLHDRTRFACEIIAAVRKRVGSDFPIIFRFSNWKLGVYDERGRVATTAAELEEWLMPLASAGVDIFHASTRNFENPEFAGSPLNLAGWTKKITGLPVITVGSVGLSSDFISERQGQEVKAASLDSLIARMNNGEFDLVAVGRALLADPNWARKVRDQEFDKIIPYDKSCLNRLY